MLHDRIMTRYYKFLVVNVLVFFCVGTVALQSFLLSFKSIASEQLATVIAQSFPVAAPFYVGWCEYISVNVSNVCSSISSHLHYCYAWRS